MKKRNQLRSAHYPAQKTMTRIMKCRLAQASAKAAAKNVWHPLRHDRKQYLGQRLNEHQQSRTQSRARHGMKQQAQSKQGQQNFVQEYMQPKALPKFILDWLQEFRRRKSAALAQDQGAKDSRISPQASKPSSKPSSQPASLPLPRPSSPLPGQQDWRPTKQEMVEFLLRAIRRCRELSVPLSELRLSCFFLLFSFFVSLFASLFVPGTASASYEEHLAGEIVSRTQNPLPGQPSLASSGSPSGSSSGSVLSLPPSATTGMRQAGPGTGLKPGLEEHGTAQPAKAGVSGKNVPLKKALAMLVPPGWTCTGTFNDTRTGDAAHPGKNQPGQKQPSVSWKKQEKWHEVLRRTAIEQNVHMTLDWQEKSIVIRQAGTRTDTNNHGTAGTSGRSASAQAQPSGRDKTRPVQETRPGDPGIISLAPLPGNTTASLNLKDASPDASPDLKAGSLTAAQAKAETPSARTAVPVPSSQTSQMASQQASRPDSQAQADPVRDALASARRDSSATAVPHTHPAGSASATSQASLASQAPMPGTWEGNTAGHTAANGASSGASSGASHGTSQGTSLAQKTSARAKASGPQAAAPLPAQRTAQHQEAQSQPQTQSRPVPASYWQIGPGSLRMQL